MYGAMCAKFHNEKRGSHESRPGIIDPPWIYLPPERKERRVVGTYKKNKALWGATLSKFYRRMKRAQG